MVMYICMSFYFFISGVSVTFVADSYTVEEQQLMLNVCAVMSGRIEVDVTISLSLQEDQQASDNMRANRKCLYSRLDSLFYCEPNFFPCSWS